MSAITMKRSAVFIAALTLTSGAVSAHADSPNDKPRPNVTLTATDPSRSADDRVTCAISVAKPNFSGGAITAVGGFKSCTPHAPWECNSETDIEWYAPGPGRWLTVGTSARVYGCPPPFRAGTARAYCEWRNGDPLYYYRTNTLGTIYYGSTDTDTATSSPLGIPCL
ncbi:hypothetical protein [Streptomyces sp. NPDC056544]|uniref:hypothetical protein n=1 Tax=unclassified Streptomyces TaxID=2593676 RepID=UPI0036B42A34